MAPVETSSMVNFLPLAVSQSGLFQTGVWVCVRSAKSHLVMMGGERKEAASKRERRGRVGSTAEAEGENSPRDILFICPWLPVIYVLKKKKKKPVIYVL